MKEEKTYNIQIGQKDVEIKTNKLAKQTNGSALVKCGDTVVLATAVMRDEPNTEIDYFPLFVEYEEHYWAAGKIRGSRFMKRKGRPTDEAVLSGRLIDRSIRPLFPKGMKNDVQIVINVLSFDFINDPRPLAFVAASAAIEISNIPFDGPLAGSMIGEKNGELVINPTIEEQEEGKLNIFVAGVGENISMVEAGGDEAQEETVIKAMEIAQKENLKITEKMKEIATDHNVSKFEFESAEVSEEAVNSLKEKYIGKFEELFNDYKDKKKYDRDLKKLTNKILETEMEAFKEGEEAKDMGKQIKNALEKIQKLLIQENILKNNKRLGGRDMNEVRELNIETTVLPRTHGSAIFTRGETQGLTTATLGAPGSEMILDGMADGPETKQRYMHFYSFPPYSVGETGFFRGPGRREIGHGALGEKSLIPVIPSKEDFPYTIIMNTEIMASDGSTSMASVCGSTLALMDAGVPIKTPIAGVAMGLVVDKNDINNYKVLTDLCANEDFAGHMDFKVAGSDKGITALQMDIKVKGLTIEILKDAIQEAKKGRLHILAKMLEVIPEYRKEMSPNAPRVEKIMIEPDKIRDLIGPGGKIINSIIDKTGVQIDIEDDGSVFVTSVDGDSMKEALKIIKAITRVPKVGEEYAGKVVKILEFGAMVEFLPEKDGLIHISKLGQGKRIDKVSDIVNIGDTVKVVIDEVDSMGRYNLGFKGKAE